MSPKLERCPFCGWPAASNFAQVGVAWVTCTDCGAEGPVEDTEAEAIAAWNRRAPASQARPAGGSEGSSLADIREMK
jgi:Lar family restriction alleviation protein